MSIPLQSELPMLMILKIILLLQIARAPIIMKTISLLDLTEAELPAYLKMTLARLQSIQQIIVLVQLAVLP